MGRIFHNKRARFIAAVAAQVAVLAGLLLFKVATLTGGTPVLLRVEPVDPRDWLRGDYVTLRFNVTRIPLHLLFDGGGRIPKKGQTVYVALDDRGSYWAPVGLSLSRPLESDVFLKGVVIRAEAEENRNRNALFPGRSRDGFIEVQYGFEEYFIPEETGWGFNPAAGNVAAEVVVDKDGRAVLRQLYVKGKPWP